jgi:hypothetical protein
MAPNPIQATWPPASVAVPMGGLGLVFASVTSVLLLLILRR